MSIEFYHDEQWRFLAGQKLYSNGQMRELKSTDCIYLDGHWHDLGNIVQDGLIFQPIELYGAGTPEVNGIYYPDQVRLYLQSFQRNQRYTLYVHENGIYYIELIFKYTATSEFQAIEWSGALTDGKTVFYRTEYGNSSVAAGSMWALSNLPLYVLYTPSMREIGSGASPCPSLRSSYPVWSIKHDGFIFAFDVTLLATSDIKAIIATRFSNTSDDSQNTIAFLAAGVEHTIKIHQGQRYSDIMFSSVGSELNSDMSSIIKIVIRDANIAEFNGLAVTALTYLDLSGNHLLRASTQQLLNMLVSYAPKDGYLDISRQSTNLMYDSNIQYSVANLRARGWTVITD